MMGNVAILDVLRRRVTGEDRYRCITLQTCYAEWLSWLSEEAGNPQGAMYWIDRTSQWAQATAWSEMAAWSFIRRSSIAQSFSGDGLRIVDHAKLVLDMSQSSPGMKGLGGPTGCLGVCAGG